MKYIPYILTMAITTYLIRMIPLTFFKKEITNIYIKSFLFYVPYAVLGAMTFPAILFSTKSFIPSLMGTITAIYLAYKEKNLITVALAACLIVFIIESL